MKYVPIIIIALVITLVSILSSCDEEAEFRFRIEKGFRIEKEPNPALFTIIRDGKTVIGYEKDGEEFHPEDVVAMTLLAECRDQYHNNYEGIRAMGQLILNRSRTRGIPVDQVCWEKGQFESWGDPQYRKMLLGYDSMRLESARATEFCEAVAEMICIGVDVYPQLVGYENVFNPERAAPDWGSKGWHWKIQDHIFVALDALKVRHIDFDHVHEANCCPIMAE